MRIHVCDKNSKRPIIKISIFSRCSSKVKMKQNFIIKSDVYNSLFIAWHNLPVSKLKSFYYFLRSLEEKNSKRFVLEIMKVSGALPSKYFYTYSTEEH